MANYIFLYKGPATPPEEMTEDSRNSEMKLWEEWMKGLGEDLVEPGNPTGEGVSVVDDGSTTDVVDVKQKL